MILQINTRHPLYQQVTELRDKILRIPLGLSLSENDTKHDASQIILVHTSDNKSINACLLLQAIDKITFKMRQLAVNTPFQKAGIGKALVLYAESYALENRAEKIILHARKTAVSFYQKLGYQTIDGEFTEVNIPHQAMEKVLLSDLIPV